VLSEPAEVRVGMAVSAPKVRATAKRATTTMRVTGCLIFS
jgi:hypothetical protein